MRFVFPPAVLLFLSFVAAPVARPDVPLPATFLNPGSPAEAWNVIRLATSNVGRLIQENRTSEIVEQIALCSPALRLLAQAPADLESRTKLSELTALAFRHVNSIAQSGMAQSKADAERFFGDLQIVLRDAGRFFEPKVVSGEVYHCRAHPDIISTDAQARCGKCNEPLTVRRIPYSFIYVQPGQATLKLAVSSIEPLAAGKKAEISLKLQTVAGAPVSPSDLLLIHTQPVHLLIVDAALGDFQVQHPVATARPGEYSFSFVPSSSGPHRIWADVVPVATGLQELPFADLGGGYTAKPATDASDVLASTAEGVHFQIAFSGGTGSQAHARQIQLMKLKVTDSNGQPVQRLEPFMNAFAHVTGFYDDHQTILRLHPSGGDILRDEVRGGPMLGFKIYPPRAGFVRFYCQVRIDGRMIIAPFAVNIAE